MADSEASVRSLSEPQRAMDGAGLGAKIGNGVRKTHFAAHVCFRSEERVSHVLVLVGDGDLSWPSQSALSLLRLLSNTSWVLCVVVLREDRPMVPRRQ